MLLDKSHNFKLTGKAKGVFKMLMVLALTEPAETDLSWWETRVSIIANDWDKVACKLTMSDRLLMREN